MAIDDLNSFLRPGGSLLSCWPWERPPPPPGPLSNPTTLPSHFQVKLKIHYRKMKLLSLVTALIAAGSTAAFAPSNVAPRSLVATNMAASEELYIDEERRFLMNLILVGSAALTVGAIGVPYIAFFVPPGSGGGSGGVPAKDALGNELFAQAYLESKPAGDRSLAQGLKGDATYLIVKDDKTLENYGLNAGKIFCWNPQVMA